MLSALQAPRAAPVAPARVLLAASAATLVLMHAASAQLSPALPDTSALFGGIGSTSLFTGPARSAGGATGLSGLSPAPASALPRLGTARLSPNAPTAMSPLGSSVLSPVPTARPTVRGIVLMPDVGSLGFAMSTIGGTAPITSAPATRAVGGGPTITNYGFGGTQPLPGSPASTVNGTP
jgi:hypothetical protein